MSKHNRLLRSHVKCMWPNVCRVVNGYSGAFLSLLRFKYFKKFLFQIVNPDAEKNCRGSEVLTVDAHEIMSRFLNDLKQELGVKSEQTVIYSVSQEF